MEYLWLVVGWIGYFILHSVLAIRQVKAFALSWGISAQIYRLIYNFVGAITLIPVFLLSSQIESKYVLLPGNALKISGLILAGAGVVLLKKSFRVYDTRSFLGLAPMKQEAFRTDGFLKYVRHPMYSTIILILIGYFMYNPKWSALVSVVMIIIYFVVGGYFEERKLIREFGDQYIQYKKRTPMLIPRLWKRQ